MDRSRPNWWGPLPVIGVSVWYTGARVARSWMGPVEGVQCVIAHHPGGARTHIDGYDEYTCPGDEAAPVKLGEEIALEAHTAVHAAAIADTWRPRE